MTDATLNKLAEKKVHEACGKLPHEKKRVLAALLAAVLAAIKQEQ
ncbi:MAG TPA: hypothetical protein VE377_09130 [Candidatus Dormibacteraeota bacterium]|nr:hypothetical protein [Candidatus Dormibacteraeota bacterium]